MDQFELNNRFKLIMLSGMQYSTYSHKILFSKPVDITIALAHLNAAISYFSSAESLYYASYDVLQCDEAEQIFHRFKEYSKEFLGNVRENHSHQWTDTEFDKLNNIFDSSVYQLK